MNNNKRSLKIFSILLVLLFLATATNSLKTNLKSKTTQGSQILLDQKAKALIQGPYAKIECIQTYTNPDDSPHEIEFSFSLPENSILLKFKAIFTNHTIVTQIFEKKETQDIIYQNNNDVKYSKRNPSTPDIRQVHIGMIQAHENVEIRFSFIQPLDVIVNQFWSFTLPYPFTENNNPWKVEVEIKSDQPFGYIHNPSHHIKPEPSAESNSKLFQAVWNATLEPSKNFVVYFRIEKSESPSTILATHPDYPNDHVLLISSIPQLNKYLNPIQAQEFLSQGEEGLKQLKNQILDMKNAKGEFIFLVDCSNSMYGERIANLRKALQAFLEMLPTDSFFNIISFGSIFSLYNQESLSSTPLNLWIARAWVNLIDSDMGRSNFFPALEQATRAPLKQGYPRTIILLTNEIKAYSWELINYIKKNAHYAKVCDVRIGPKASKYLMKEIGKAGGCIGQLITEPENMRDEAMNVIHAAIAPYLEDIKIYIECFNAQNQLVFAEKRQQNFLAKDEPLKTWIYLKDISQFESCNVTISYLNKTQGCKIDSFKTAENSSVWHKIAFSSKIQELLENASEWNFYQWIEKKVIELSARYQIFSNYITFLAVFRENIIDSQTKKIPKVISANRLSFRLQDVEAELLANMIETLKSKKYEQPIEIMEFFYIGFWVFFIYRHLRKNKTREGSRKENYDEIVRRLTHQTS